jgi:twitching motility protein PilT
MGKFSLIDLFKMMHTRGASDIHLKSDAVPAFRIKGEITRLKVPPISKEQLKEMVYEVLTKKDMEFFEQEGNLDAAVSIPRVGRFRINIFRQRGTLTLVGRRISYFIPDFESLNLPSSLGKITNFINGLVLVTGPTGSGKSSTLAALINHINKTRNCHILCIEDPIEFLYQDEKAIINQREVGLDVKSFKESLKYAMREDPDIILIGEMRDEETVEFALNCAETGHLIFATLHSSNARQTIQRILNYFPQERHSEIRQALSLQLKTIVCQLLIPSCKEEINSVPACEIMFLNPTISRLIVEGRDEKISRALKAARNEGMQDFDQALTDLVNQGFITQETALKHAESPQSLELKLKGIVLSDEGGIVS